MSLSDQLPGLLVLVTLSTIPRQPCRKVKVFDEVMHVVSQSGSGYVVIRICLSSSIASLYKDVAFEKPAVFVRDLLQSVWNARLRDRIVRRQAMAGLLPSKTLEIFEPECLELPPKVKLN